jgi:hypothetical protein
MSDDVAKLGLEVDSSGLDKGSEKLKQFSKDADGAAKSADNFNKSASNGSEKVAQTTAQQAGAFDKVKTAVAGMTEAQLGAVTVIGALGAAAAAAAVGAGVLAYQWSAAQGKIEQALIGIGARTGTTIGQINAFSFANATATGLSVGQARDAAIEFTKTGNIAVGQLKGLGDAVYGFSVLTGKDAADATKTLAKALSGDLVKGAEQLDQTYGFLDGRTREYIADLQAAGQTTKAQQVIIDATAEANRKAADSVDVLSKAWAFLGNTLSSLKNAIPNALSGGPLEDRLAAAKTRVSDLQTPRLAADSQTVEGGAGSPELAAAEASLQKLQAEFDKVDASNAVAQMQKVSKEADNVVKSVFPQIDQIRNLQTELNKLKEAQDNNGGFQGQSAGNDSAATAIQNQITAMQDAMAQAVRYNEILAGAQERVAALNPAWAGVSQATAVALEKLNEQLPVAQAIGAEAQRQAQYYATINTLLAQGKSEVDAIALAQAQYTLSQEKAIASAQQQTDALQEQNELAKARTPEQQKQIAAQQAFTKAMKETGDEQTAINRAAAVTESYIIKANNAQRQAAASALEWQQNMLGVSQAAMQAADASQQAAEAFENAARAASKGSFAETTSFLFPNATDADGGGANGYTSTGTASYKSGGGGQTIGVQPGTLLNWESINAAFSKPPPSPASTADTVLTAGGSVLSAITAAQNASIKSLDDLGTKISTVSSLYDLLNKQTADKTAQAANLQQELAWLSTQPQTLQTQQKMADLTSSINSLIGSTDGLNRTMGDVLSPYYTQDPRTSHLGFRTGFATGGEFTVPGGISVNDNMIAHIPVASGERVMIDPPASRGGRGGGPINISMPITVIGNPNKDEFGRTAYQMAQTVSRQLRAS